MRKLETGKLCKSENQKEKEREKRKKEEVVTDRKRH